MKFKSFLVIYRKCLVTESDQFAKVVLKSCFYDFELRGHLKALQKSLPQQQQQQQQLGPLLDLTAIAAGKKKEEMLKIQETFSTVFLYHADYIFRGYGGGGGFRRACDGHSTTIKETQRHTFNSHNFFFIVNFFGKKTVVPKVELNKFEPLCLGRILALLLWKPGKQER